MLRHLRGRVHEEGEQELQHHSHYYLFPEAGTAEETAALAAPPTAPESGARNPDLSEPARSEPRPRDQDISFASEGNEEEDEEDEETTVSSDSSKYLESINKLTKIFEKSELSRAEERKLLTKLMKRRDNDRLERTEETEDEPIMIDEAYHIKDDGVSTIDMELRLRLTTPNVDPSSYWTKAVSSRYSKPRKGNNLYLDHLSQAQVAPLTIRRMSDRGAIIRIPHLLARNAGVEFSDDNAKRLKVQGRGDTTTVNMG